MTTIQGRVSLGEGCPTSGVVGGRDNGSTNAERDKDQGIWFNSWADVAHVSELYLKNRQACVQEIMATFNIPCRNGLRSLFRSMMTYCPPSICKDVAYELEMQARYAPDKQWRYTIYTEVVKEHAAAQMYQQSSV